MISFNSQLLGSTGIGLTQAHHMGMLGADITATGDGETIAARTILPTGEMMGTTFSRTFAASLTSEYFFEVGVGHVEPALYGRLLLQHAAEVRVPFSTVVESFTNYIQKVALDAEYWRRLVAFTTGPTRRVLKASDVAHVTPTAVLSFVREQGGADGYDIFYHFMTDFVCGILGKLGFLQADSGYTFRSSRIETFPTRENLVDVVRAVDLVRILTAMSDVDVAPLQKTFRERNAVLPMLLASQLNNAASLAFERTRGSYDADAVVDSILLTLGRIWAPVMPDALQPKQRVVNSGPIQELRTNLAMFLAYQEARATRPNLRIAFGDEEMTSTILPLFMEAMATVSPYKVRPLKDATKFIGQRSVLDYTGAPSSMTIFEDHSFSNSITAFTPIKHLSAGNAYFLKPETTISERLSDSLAKMSTTMSVRAFVEQRAATAEGIPETRRVKDGVDVTLALVTLESRDFAIGAPRGLTSRALKTGVVDIQSEDGVRDQRLSDHLKAVVYNYYALITHYACSGMSDVAISQMPGDESLPALYLVWREHTALKMPLGVSTISGGSVLTTEPLEAILYRGDVTPSEPITTRNLDLTGHVRSLHIWDWHAASSSLMFRSSYPTTIGGKKYEVNLTEHEMLSLGATRERVRFIVPPVAKSMASLWLTWLLEEYAFVNEQIEDPSDTLTQIGFAGRRLQISMSLLLKLEAIGASTIGSTTSRLVVQRLVAKMVGDRVLDEVSKLSYGVQQRHIRIWAGLAILQMLGGKSGLYRAGRWVTPSGSDPGIAPQKADRLPGKPGR